MTPERLVTVGIDIRLIGKQRTGDEVVFFQLVRELIRRRDDAVHYELFTDETDDARLAALRLRLEALGREDIEIVSLPARNRFIWNLCALPWRLFRHPVDVFHTQYILPFFLSKRLRIVTHIHDVSFLVHPEWIGALDRFFLALFMPRTFRRSERIIAPSEFTRSEIIAHTRVLAERVIVIENAAAEEWFQSVGEDDITRVTTRYGLTPGRYFISSGTMQPRKNIAFLIEAFTEAKEKLGLEFPLVLTGNVAGHNVDSRTKEKIADQNIVAVGYVSDADLRVLVAAAAAYVFPSLYEGFGIPIEESLAVGTPVLAADIPVFREVGRERITYFDPRRLAALSEILYTFSIDISSGKREGKRFSSGEQMYSWAKSAAKLAALYRNLMDTSQ